MKDGDAPRAPPESLLGALHAPVTVAAAVLGAVWYQAIAFLEPRAAVAAAEKASRLGTGVATTTWEIECALTLRLALASRATHPYLLAGVSGGYALTPRVVDTALLGGGGICFSGRQAPFVEALCRHGQANLAAADLEPRRYRALILKAGVLF